MTTTASLRRVLWGLVQVLLLALLAVTYQTQKGEDQATGGITDVSLKSKENVSTHVVPVLTNQDSVKQKIDANLVRTAEMQLNPPFEVRDKKHMNFFTGPNRFVNEFAECIHDKKCRIYFMHPGKTGGTTIEYRMFKMFPQMKRRSCCFTSMMTRFQKSKKKYCQAKFTAYQVMGKAFTQVVSECMKINQGSRAVALVSFREPIQRTLSAIHQGCNKNFHRRPEHKKQACRNCSYDKDKAYWDGFAQKTNKVYDGIRHVTELNMPNVTVMSIDTPDITSFFSQLSTVLPEKYKMGSSTTKNKQNTHRCSFGMKSPMFKALRPSQAIYRNLTVAM